MHLHVHSEYSLLDGANRIKELVARVKEMGQPAVAITDHGVMYGVIDFYKECMEQGIKPIIGCEVYMSVRELSKREGRQDLNPYHLVLLCKDLTGYHNLIKLVSAGFLEGFYGKPRVDSELLAKYSEGLIALTACLSGKVPRLLTRGDYEGAKSAAEELTHIYGRENVYIELQNHGIKEQGDIIPSLLKIARELSLGVVATNDAHYLKKEDSELQKVLTAIQTNRVVEDGVLEFETDEFYMKSRLEMENAFKHDKNVPISAFENTLTIAERCNVNFTFGEIRLPKYTGNGTENNAELLKRYANEGFRRIYGDNAPQSYRDRLTYELNTIEQMGYQDYFLIVGDFIHYAKSRGIPVGPGRGSGAGSMVAYCIGITGVDPMQYGLIFERFLNAERVTMPDFDIDFCNVRRQEVIDYVVDKYGDKHVAQIITFGTLGARASIRDVSRALGVNYQTADRVAKLIPFSIGMTIEKALKLSAEFRELYNSSREVGRVVDFARQLEGMPRHASVHAAGVVITQNPVDSYVPLQKGDFSAVTQYSMGILEELGLLKMDFLGLRNLTIIDDCVKMLKPQHPSFKIENIPLDDKNVFEMLTHGHTDGVFQFESGGILSVLARVVPTGIEDLIAVTSLYRPGPMDYIPDFIKNRHNPEAIVYDHPLLEPILSVTYGVIVYQEQVLEILRKLGGFSYGQADIVRRAMSKKKADVMRKTRDEFIYGIKEGEGVPCVGAVANGVPAEVASVIFDKMESFAAYAFNKSHAAAYALIAYQTAYLKCNYPKEYMAALMGNSISAKYKAESERLGLKVLPPDVNSSASACIAVEEGIRFGLSSVKNVGHNVVKNIVLTRESDGKFKDYRDFLSRVAGHDLNRKALESLIMSGALDCFELNRRTLIECTDKLLDEVGRRNRDKLSGQLGLFGDNDSDIVSEQIAALPEYPVQMLLKQEKDLLGIYLSGHPLEIYRELWRSGKVVEISTLTELGTNGEVGHSPDSPTDGTMLTIAGTLVSKKQKTTRKGDIMCFLRIEDMTDALEVLVFPTVFEKFGQMFTDEATLTIRGRLSLREGEAAKVIMETAAPASVPPPKQKQRKTDKSGLYLKLPSKDYPNIPELLKTLSEHPGNLAVYVYFEREKELTRAPGKLLADGNAILLTALKRSLGEKNVAVKQ